MTGAPPRGLETALDLHQAPQTEDQRHVIGTIREHGWMCTAVLEDEGPGTLFAYSTGFWLNLGYPEILTVGVPQEQAHGAMWRIWDEVKAGRPPPVGEPCQGVANGAFRVCLIPLAPRHFEEYLVVSRWFYLDQAFPALHLVSPDGAGRLPWERMYHPYLRGTQPDLSEEGWDRLFGVKRRRLWDRILAFRRGA